MDEFVDFGEAVLRNLETLAPPGTVQADIALELGLCAWMHRCDTDLDEALDRLWGVRGAVLEAGRLDPDTEPIPFGGRQPQSALVNLVIYLGELLVRAASSSGWDTRTLVDRACEHLASPAARSRFGGRRLRERRSS